MNVLSLFDGMSCGQLAMKRAGIKIDNYYASEIDKYAIKIANKNFPNTKQVGSVLNLDGNELPKIDLLIGGSPCQSFSRSGNGSGFDGKSKLFFEYIRILKEVKPKYFLLENVIMKKEWEDVITDYLGVEPIMIDSKLVSAQKRQRLYWTNIDGIEQPKDKNIKIKDIITGDHEIINDNPVVIGKACNDFIIKNGTVKGYLIAEEGDGVNLEFVTSKTRRGRVSKQKVNTLNTACNYATVLYGDLVRLNINEIEKLQTVPVNYTEGVSENQRRKMIGNGWTVEVVTCIFKKLK